MCDCKDKRAFCFAGVCGTKPSLLPGDICYSQPKQRTAAEVLGELVDVTRSHQIADRRVREAEDKLAGEKNHQANVIRYKVNLELELAAAVKREAAAK